MPRGIYLRTEEYKRNLGKTKLGKNNPMFGVHRFGKLNPFYGKKHSEESIQKMKKSHKEYYKNNIHPLLGKENKWGHHSDKGKKNISLANMGEKNHFYGKKHNEETIRRLKIARKKRSLPFKDTSIEIKIQNFLKVLHVEFMPHYYISNITNKYQCDIFVPSIKTIIECDGCYFHNCPTCKIFLDNGDLAKSILEQMEEDKIRTQELQEKGYRVIRLWEHEIKKMDINEFKIVINNVKGLNDLKDRLQ